MSLTSPLDDYLDWCIAHPGSSQHLDVDGVDIHYLEWQGPAGAPCLLLVHGFMGHAHWWDFVAPALAEDYRVLAMDLSGMGDSGWRDSYTLEIRAVEIAAVLEHADATDMTLIGHSFGGRCAILTAHAFPQLMKRAITVDTHVSVPDPERMRSFSGIEGRAKKRYTDLAYAKSRFRLVPGETGTPPVVLDHIAGNSLKEDDGAWIWKFDSKIMARSALPDNSDARALPLLQVPLDYVYGEHSAVVSKSHAATVAGTIVSGRAPIQVPAGGHHLPLGQPIATVATLRALLMQSNSKPNAGKSARRV